MTINKLFLTGAISGLIMTSCTSFNPEKTAKQWDVTQIGTQKVVPGPNSPYIGFEDGKIFGFTGCNRINGGIEIDGSSFKASNVGTTMKFCPDAKFEQDFLQALNKAEEIKESATGFELLGKEGKTLVSFAPHTLDVKLLEGQWNLISMNGKDVEQQSEAPFIIFDLKEKRMSGFTGCNRINDNLDLKALGECNLNLKGMAMTRRMCNNNVFEADFIDALNASHNINVEDNKLYIYSEDDVHFLIFEKE